jgi:hypothetical protein
MVVYTFLLHLHLRFYHECHLYLLLLTSTWNLRRYQRALSAIIMLWFCSMLHQGRIVLHRIPHSRNGQIHKISLPCYCGTFRPSSELQYLVCTSDDFWYKTQNTDILSTKTRLSCKSKSVGWSRFASREGTGSRSCPIWRYYPNTDMERMSQAAKNLVRIAGTASKFGPCRMISLHWTGRHSILS